LQGVVGVLGLLRGDELNEGEAARGAVELLRQATALELAKGTWGRKVLVDDEIGDRVRKKERGRKTSSDCLGEREGGARRCGRAVVFEPKSSLSSLALASKARFLTSSFGPGLLLVSSRFRLDAPLTSVAPACLRSDTWEERGGWEVCVCVYVCMCVCVCVCVSKGVEGDKSTSMISML
jgi:hypothetical protein